MHAPTRWEVCYGSQGRDSLRVLSVCMGCLRKSQAKTLSELVAAAAVCGRLSLAQLGWRSRGSALAKHRIKRAWRFLSSPRIEPMTAWACGIDGTCLRARGRATAGETSAVRSPLAGRCGPS